MIGKERALNETSARKARIARMYDFMANFYCWFGTLFFRERLRLLHRHIDLDEHHSLIDVGTGPGIVPITLRNKGHRNPMAAIDLSPVLVEKANRRANKLDNNGIDFRIGDMENIPFPDKSFDRLTCVFTLLITPDKERAVSEFNRVLKDGAKGVIVEPKRGGKVKDVFYYLLSCCLKIGSMFIDDLGQLDPTDYKGVKYMDQTDITQLIERTGMTALDQVEGKAFRCCVFIKDGKP